MTYALKSLYLRTFLIASLSATLNTVVTPANAFAQFQDEVGYTRLVEELNLAGKSLPSGAGIRVGIVEAFTSNNQFPNLADSQFSGKNIQGVPSTPGSPTASAHATTVLKNFVGNSTSMTPGVTEIDVYDANFFINSILLSNGQPAATNVSVLNHSYVGSVENDPGSTYTNSRMDHVINRDQLTNVVGLSNKNPELSAELYANSFNSISVGLTNGNHIPWVSNGPASGRTAPHLVAPSSATSYATPIVSSAAALLQSVAIEENLNNGTRPETIKAILMGGADKNAFGPDYVWSNTSAHPLDATYGAGEVDVYNSYKILTGGEHDGSLTFDITPTSLAGWDFGQIGADESLYWYFEIGSGLTANEASFLLTWNAHMEDELGNIDLSEFALANMSLNLYSANDLLTPLSFSDSQVDNVEHIYLKDLAAGQYAFSVSSNLSSTFAIAWNVSTVPEPTSLALLATLGCAMGFCRLSRGSKELTVEQTTA